MASYLVTGGAGFIGSHLAEELVRRGHTRPRRRQPDHRQAPQPRSHPAAWSSSKATWPTCAFAHARRRRAWTTCCTRRRFRRCRGRSKDPITSNRANVDAHAERARRRARRRRQAPGVRRLLVGIRQHADAAQARGHADRARCRRTRCRRSIGEQYCQMFTRLYGFETVVDPLLQRLRAAAGSGLAVFGRHLALRDARCIEGGQPTIYGDGEQTRDFTYVANVVDGVLRACEAPKAAGEVINVACGGRISLNELLRVMNTIVGTDIEPIYKEARAGDVRTCRPTSPKPERFSATRRSSGSRTGCAIRWWCRHAVRRRAPAAEHRTHAHLMSKSNMRIPGLTLRRPTKPTRSSTTATSASRR